MKFQRGDIVKVKDERKTGTVRAILPDQHGVLLEEEVGGYRLWNLDEVELVQRPLNRRREVSDEASAKSKAKAIERWSKAQKKKASLPR